MKESKTVNSDGSDPMVKHKGNTQTSIQVPNEKYALLEDIKKETGKPISKLVVEGVDLILIKYEDVLKEHVKNALTKADSVETILSEIKKQ